MKDVYPYPDRTKHPRIEGYLWHVVFTVKQYKNPMVTETHEVDLHLVHYSSDAQHIRNMLYDEYSDFGKNGNVGVYQDFDELKSATFMGMVHMYTVP